MPVPGRVAIAIELKRDEQFWPLARKIASEARIVEVQQARAEALGLAVDDIEYLHLLALR